MTVKKTIAKPGKKTKLPAVEPKKYWHLFLTVVLIIVASVSLLLAAYNVGREQARNIDYAQYNERVVNLCHRQPAPITVCDNATASASTSSSTLETLK